MKAKRGMNFDNFYVYDGNRVAYLAGQKIVQFPGELFNPFYVYSGTGLGKTHLLWAIHAELNKRSAVLFFTGKEFEKYIDDNRDYAISLIVDDLHAVTEKYHEIILEIIDRALAENKQVCFSGNAAPREVKNFSVKLASRLEGGLSCDIQPPKEMFLVEMIKKKSEESGIILPDDIALELAQISSGSIRTIEGMINRLVAYSSLGQIALDLSTIRLILKEFYPRGVFSPVSSLLEELKKNATDVLQGVPEQLNQRDEYREKIYIWEMKGFDTTALKPLLDGEIEILVREYDNFIKKVEILVELQKEFGTLDVSQAPDEAMKIETMFFSPDRIGEIKNLIRKIRAKSRSDFKTFETFILGDCNKTAMEIYRNTILPSLGKKFNPFIVIGGKGSGKTHFLQAVYSDLVAQGINAVFCDFNKDRGLPKEEISTGDAVIVDNFSSVFNRPDEERKRCFEAIMEFVKKDCEVIMATDSFPDNLSLTPGEKTVFELGIEVKFEPPSPDVVLKYARVNAPHELTELMVKTGFPKFESFYEVNNFIKDFKPIEVPSQAEIPLEIRDEKVTPEEITTPSGAAEKEQISTGEVVALGLPGEEVAEPEPAVENISGQTPEGSPVFAETETTGEIADERKLDEAASAAASLPSPEIKPLADDLFAIESEASKSESPSDTPNPAAKAFKPLKDERLIMPEIFGELIEENF